MTGLCKATRVKASRVAGWYYQASSLLPIGSTTASSPEALLLLFCISTIKLQITKIYITMCRYPNGLAVSYAA